MALETDLAMMKIYATEKAMGVGPDPEKDLSVAGETAMAKDMEAGLGTVTETAEARVPAKAMDEGIGDGIGEGAGNDNI